MARRVDSNADETRVTIIDAAFLLFGQFGYDAVSIEKISKAAGLSKSALYWHFKNKAQLFVACLEKLDAIFDQYVFDPVATEPDPIRSVIAFFEGLGGLLQDDVVERGIGGYWLDSHGVGTSIIREVQEQHETARAVIAANTFLEGRHQGKFRFTANPDDMARALIAVMEAVILPLRRHTPEENIRTLQFLMETFLRAYAEDWRQ